MPPLRPALLALLLIALPVRAEVILHAFNWRYADITARADEIRSLGYSAVLVASPVRSEGNDWWMRYQPQDYRVIDHPLGNTDAFRAMSAALEARGIALHVDLVLNHMANESARRSDLNYPGSRVLASYAANPTYFERQRLFGDLSTNLFDAADFNPAFCISDYNNREQVQRGRLCGGNGDAGLPDLASSAKVIAAQRAYLAALVGLGVDGFRLDAAKHMPLSHVNAVFTVDVVGSRPVYGEIITGGGTGNTEYGLYLLPWLSDTALAAYDFPLFHRLRSAFGFGGNLASLLSAEADGQALPTTRAITFAVNHDIPLNGIFRGLIMEATDETLAWAWLLGSGRGTPLLYSDNNESGDNRWANLYRRGDIAAMLRFHKALAGTDSVALESSPCHILLRRGGRGLLAINKCGEARTLSLPLEGLPLNPTRAYRDTLSGDRVFPRNDTLTLNLPARTARLWLIDDADNGCGTRSQRAKERLRCVQANRAESSATTAPESGARDAPPRRRD